MAAKGHLQKLNDGLLPSAYQPVSSNYRDRLIAATSGRSRVQDM